MQFNYRLGAVIKTNCSNLTLYSLSNILSEFLTDLWKTNEAYITNTKTFYEAVQYCRFRGKTESKIEPQAG